MFSPELNNENLYEIIQEIKEQSETIEKKYIDKNKTLKAKLREMEERLKTFEEIDQRKTFEIDELKKQLNYVVKSYNSK
jgi:hypothetical protein